MISFKVGCVGVLFNPKDVQEINMNKIWMILSLNNEL